MRKLLIATRSKGKLPEIKLGLKGLPFEIIGLAEVPGLPADFEVPETGKTFEENAIIKARAYGDKTELLTLAEDAGLEVDALGGRPGVYSARYTLGTDKDRYEKLLGELKGVPFEKRIARFRAVIAIYDPENGKIETCEGIYEGKIALESKGENGFGYDPIFWNEELKKMNGEMTAEEKNRVSHRGIALRKARKILIEIN